MIIFQANSKLSSTINLSFNVNERVSFHSYDKNNLLCINILINKNEEGKR